MTTFDYQRAVDAANRLLKRYGQLGALRQPPAAEGDAWNPQRPGQPTNHPAYFAIVDFEQGEIDGDRVLATDKKAVMAPGTIPITPDTTHQLVETGDPTPWTIVHVDVLRPAQTTLLYTLQVRR